MTYAFWNIPLTRGIARVFGAPQPLSAQPESNRRGSPPTAAKPVSCANALGALLPALARALREPELLLLGICSQFGVGIINGIGVEAFGEPN